MKFDIKTVAVAIERTDGAVAIMRLVVAGRSGQLPENAAWTDQPSGAWMRFATDEVVEAEVRRAVPDALRWQRITESVLPGDRTYRSALQFDLSYDMPKARDIHRNLLRHERANVLVALDAQWQRATGQGKKAEANAVEAQRQRWRDAPADPRIEAAQTVEHLKAIEAPHG